MAVLGDPRAGTRQAVPPAPELRKHSTQPPAHPRRRDKQHVAVPVDVQCVCVCVRVCVCVYM